MNRRHFNASLLAAAAGSGCASAPSVPSESAATAADPLRLDPSRHTTGSVEVGGRTVAFRAFENLPVVAHPVEPGYQVLNLYVPEVYFTGGRLGAFDARSAPVFLPNAVGGYLPARPGTLTDRQPGPPGPAGQAAALGASAVALSRGFVVAAPGARGRTQRAPDGRWTGKAPAALVDLKAAVRWLRHNADRIPGNMERIVSNGTSAGGALSALLGASGNHPDHEEALRALGAAPARDDVFAVSAYCPITHLAHADAAYEWQFEGLRAFRNVAISMLDFHVQRQEVVGQLDDAQVALSAQMRADFVAHVNALGLRGPDGTPLTLQPDGGGALRDHVGALLRQSAQRALDAGQDLSGVAWLTVRGGRVSDVDVAAHARSVGRMKAQPAFDGFALENGENQLFGDALTDKRHFTAFSAARSRVPGAAQADERTVRAMDAVQRLGDAGSTVARHWRIRHGTLDRDTSLAVPALLAAAARQRGAAVDLALPWGRPHSGDYDLEELFAWAEAAVVGAA